MLSKFISELIETLWNVNKNTMELKEIESIELIETLWNVNFNMAYSNGLMYPN